MTLVKLCGLRSIDDIRHANEAGPDMAGMIMAPGFRRSVDKELAKAMVGELSDSIRSVGVFVDQDLDEVIDTARYVGFDMVQLHGSEDEGFITAVRNGLGIPVIKSFGVSPDQISAAKESSADMVLIDPGRGSGETFDLSLLIGFGRSIIIAGGLTPDNVSEAIRKVRPYGVDTSSGIESEGSKDREKMIRFVSAVRAENNQKEEKE
ncbi:MAG: phosphoribosylanthranilate isomerase [Candidatus Methanomethylophilaceae archaeon]|nr:phosphoribosylanthranilate isomerase [Candidatus Methanomethylophilaceae archaeon]